LLKSIDKFHCICADDTGFAGDVDLFNHTGDTGLDEIGFAGIGVFDVCTEGFCVPGTFGVCVSFIIMYKFKSLK